MNKSDRSSAIAAAIILLSIGLGFFFLPTIMLWLGGYSPYLAAVVGAFFVLAIFIILWLRALYQRRRDL